MSTRTRIILHDSRGIPVAVRVRDAEVNLHQFVSALKLTASKAPTRMERLLDTFKAVRAGAAKLKLLGLPAPRNLMLFKEPRCMRSMYQRSRWVRECLTQGVYLVPPKKKRMMDVAEPRRRFAPQAVALRQQRRRGAQAGAEPDGVRPRNNAWQRFVEGAEERTAQRANARAVEAPAAPAPLDEEFPPPAADLGQYEPQPPADWQVINMPQDTGGWVQAAFGQPYDPAVVYPNAIPEDELL